MACAVAAIGRARADDVPPPLVRRALGREQARARSPGLDAALHDGASSRARPLDRTKRRALCERMALLWRRRARLRWSSRYGRHDPLIRLAPDAVDAELEQLAGRPLPDEAEGEPPFEALSAPGGADPAARRGPGDPLATAAAPEAP